MSEATTEGWQDLLKPLVARHRDRTGRRYFRTDAALASLEVYAYPEAEGFYYAICLPTNEVLQRRILHRLRRPVGRPPQHVWRY